MSLNSGSSAANEGKNIVTPQEIGEVSQLIRHCPPASNVDAGRVVITVTGNDDDMSFRRFAFSAKPSGDNQHPSQTVIERNDRGGFRVWIDKNPPIFLYDSTNPKVPNTLSFDQTARLREFIAGYMRAVELADVR